MLNHTSNLQNVMVRFDPGVLDYRRNLTNDDSIGGRHIAFLSNAEDQDGCLGEVMELVSPNECVLSSTISHGSTIFDIEVFPNPTSDIIQIRSFGENGNSIRGQLTIFNLDGNIVEFVKTRNLDNIQIDMIELPNGIYYVILSSETAEFKSQNIGSILKIK